MREAIAQLWFGPGNNNVCPDIKVTVSPKWSGGPMIEEVEVTFANKIVFRFRPSCSWKDEIKILCTTSCKQTNININIENALKIHKFCELCVCIDFEQK
jgi:hypothetical protein